VPHASRRLRQGLDANWRSLVARSAALALAMLLHLGLFLFLLTPPMPWLFRPSRSSARESVLKIDFPPRPRRATAPKATESAPARVPFLKHARTSHAFAYPIAPAQPATKTPPPVDSAPSMTAPAIPYGNASFGRTLQNARSSGLPPLPGTDFVIRAPDIQVVPPPSLKSRVRALGKWLNCKNALFKGRMTDEELLKRGLTHRQMNQAYTELGCP